DTGKNLVDAMKHQLSRLWSGADLVTSGHSRYTGIMIMYVKHLLVRWMGILALLIVVVSTLAACTLPGSDVSTTASGVTDINGLARIEATGGAVDFQVSSGLTGEKLPGIRINIAIQKGRRFAYADDPTGLHLPIAVPLIGDTTVRRLSMPPKSLQGYNIATAAGVLNVDALDPLGVLNEEAIRTRLKNSEDVAVLLYLYNPARPLALTGAALDAYAMPFSNVTVLKAGAEPSDTQLALVVVGMRREAYDTWSNLAIDRYLASRIGQQPDIDLRDSLALHWTYPVFEIYPSKEIIEVGEEASATLRFNWRSSNPDPPPPWSFFVSSDNPAVTVSPENFLLGPDIPPQEVTIYVDRAELEAGDYSATIVIQPFSDTAGLIEQQIERKVTFTLEQKPPTPTPGPAPDSMTIVPDDPRIGDILKISASGFNAGESIVVDLVGDEHSLHDALPLADALGAFSYQVDLSTFKAGTYDLRITGSESGITGSKTITIQEPLPDALVASDELNIRYQPFSDSPVVEVLVRGDPLQVIAVNGDDSWLEVITANGTRGWVMTRFVQLNIDLSTVPWNSAYPAP
ncbi:MAG: SH3 domain-containing protein, partial [Anaerolineae bacterium]|nr:SH3 domain-containing protein [Anaerolineae bacterium]